MSNSVIGRFSMLTSHTPETLKAFEQEIAEAFNAGKIRAPVHLDGGNESQLIEIFQNVKADDWICGTWRMHYKCLLKGVPPDELKDAIFSGRSISLCFPEYRIFSSAIVGGSMPVAVGLAKMGHRVWCFLGDMAHGSGIFQECCEYGYSNNLAITFVVEDNGISVCTPTKEMWRDEQYANTREILYRYHLPWPHAGAGKRVQF